jgi:TBCC domain-containing protein 1
MLVPGDARVEGCQRATLLLRDTDVSGTGAIRLWDCSEAVIYCLAPCAVTSLSNCTDCTVVVGACAAALRLEHCERCTVVAAAGHVQLRSCHGCSLHVFTPRPVLVLGDTRHCRVGPHNTWYDALGAHLARAGLPVGAAASANRCFEAFTLHPPAHMHLPAAGGEALSAAAAGKSAAAAAQAGAAPDAAAPSGRATPVPGGVAITACGVTSLPPEEYAPLVVPFSVCSREGQAETAPTSTGGAAPGSPFSLPPGYVAALEARLRRVADVQGAVRDAQLDESKRKELQAAIQGHFREWLVVTGNMRQVVDLSRVATGGHGAGL